MRVPEVQHARGTTNAKVVAHAPRCAPPAPAQVLSESMSRGRWLVGLMAAQSLSSVILDRYSALLREHLVITLFLTML
jgi:Mg/Co/Ni transporter MgtE